jgi:hypothetical protein
VLKWLVLDDVLSINLIMITPRGRVMIKICNLASSNLRKVLYHYQEQQCSLLLMHKAERDAIPK